LPQAAFAGLWQGLVALRDLDLVYVGLGSEAVILARSPDVCSFPDSGEKADILQPLRSCKTDFFVAVFFCE
jgi:hypothetical protein